MIKGYNEIEIISFSLFLFYGNIKLKKGDVEKK